MNKLWSLKVNIKKIVQNNIEPPKQLAFSIFKLSAHLYTSGLEEVIP